MGTTQGDYVVLPADLDLDLNSESDPATPCPAAGDPQMNVSYDRKDPPRRISQHHLRDHVNRCGDLVLGCLSNRFFLYVAAVWVLLVVVDGALFFFLLVGWTTIQDQDFKNWLLNESIQILNYLFTYMAMFNLPDRIAKGVGLVGYRCGLVGRDGFDFKSRPSDEVFFSIPWGHRSAIVVLLVLNSLTQFVNQGFRLVYRTYDASNTWPGVLWCNLFFAASFACGIGAGAYEGTQTAKLKRAQPHRFPPNPVEELFAKLAAREGDCRGAFAQFLATLGDQQHNIRHGAMSLAGQDEFAEHPGRPALQ